MYSVAKAAGESDLVIERNDLGVTAPGHLDSGAGRRNAVQQSTRSESLVERLYKSRLQLQTVTAEYAMYLPDGQQQKIASELLFLLDAESWMPDDDLPVVVSFRNLMMWSVISEQHAWDSLGFDTDGCAMVAWVSEHGTFTAKFRIEPFVQWSLHVQKAADMSETSAGLTSIKMFVASAEEHLEKIA